MATIYRKSLSVIITVSRKVIASTILGSAWLHIAPSLLSVF